MKSVKLNFNIEIESIEKKMLKVKLFMQDLPEVDVLHLFKSKANVVNVNSFVPTKDDTNFLHFKIDKKNSILFEYTVSLEGNSKFGKLGNISSDTLAFTGEQVFLLPYEAINLGKNKEEFMFEISIEYSLNSYKDNILPFENDTKTLITTSSWSDVFSFLKSAYIFSNTLTSNSFEKLNIHSDGQLDDIITQNIKSIYTYFEGLFGDSINLDVTILSNNDKSFAGASNNSICSTFDLNDKRDYKLLSKRIFSAFMQSKLKSSVLFAPPNLWIMEGLSVYYENKALDLMDDDSKKRLNLSFENEYKKLYRIYLHSIKTNEKLYNFPVILDGSLKSYALIEYLYNIKAPLLIKLFEENAISKDSDSILKYLCSLEDVNKFLQPNMFEEILGEKVHLMAKNFIFGTNTIPLEIDIKGDIEEIKEQILEFENTMAMYFRIDNINRERAIKAMEKANAKKEDSNEEVATTK